MITHFNNTTLREKTIWTERNEITGCIYNVPVRIKDTIPLLNKLYVIEMNNEMNQIIGIGKIINIIRTDQKCSIYNDNNYNRFTYRGKYYIEREKIHGIDISTLETRLFKGKSHLKRGQGILQVPKDISITYLSDLNKLFNSYNF